jgi:hypothetical protein
VLHAVDRRLPPTARWSQADAARGQANTGVSHEGARAPNVEAPVRKRMKMTRAQDLRSRNSGDVQLRVGEAHPNSDSRLAPAGQLR